MKTLTHIATTALILISVAFSGTASADTIEESIANTNRIEANSTRDGARKPDQVLAFIDLDSGDAVLDYGASGGYWTELFSSVVGGDGKVYAHQNPGERFDGNKAALTEQFAPFGNIELMPVARGDAFPLDDHSVDTVMLSYVFHHMHYNEESGEEFPASSTALFAEFSRVLKPGGTVIIIEHASADGSSRTESGGWHRTPPEMAKSDLAAIGFELADEAPEIFHNPEDDLMNKWFEVGLSGKTTTFVHKYRAPE